MAVTAGQSIVLADITGGKLKFTPAANANGNSYASFTFQVQDDGGTANGGVDLDASPNTITVNVTSVNDAPQGTNNTVTTLEDTAYVFASADFGFSDASDSPANNLLAVKISTLPGAGSLTDNGVAVTAGQFVSATDISSDTGALFKANDSGHGGWGACATHDGAGPFRTMAHGDTRLIPIELQESMYPYRVEEFCLRQDSGGPGKWRGGLGFDKQYILLAPFELWANFDRIGCPPWGVQGAKAGKSGQVLIFKNGKAEPELVYKVENCPLQAGDRVRMSTGGGGG